jgi:hypothetical protein
VPEQHERERGPGATELLAEHEAEEAALKDAAHVIESWNRSLEAGRDSLWSPTIKAALLAPTLRWSMCASMLPAILRNRWRSADDGF